MMPVRTIITLFVAFAAVAIAAPLTSSAASAAGNVDCNTLTSCDACASQSSWVPSSNCRWCPKENMCHSEGSVYNTCSSSENIYKPDKCSGTPAPSPPPPAPQASSFAEKAITELFKLLKITDVDPSTCVSDVGRADVLFRDFAEDAAAKNATQAMSSLSRGLSALSSAVAGCGVTEVQNKIDMLAASVKWAKISTSNFDKDISAIVGASDLWDDVVSIEQAVTSGDDTAAGNAIGKLLTDWTTIVGGCKASSLECNFLNGFLKLAQAVAKEVEPCEAALVPSLRDLLNATTLFKAKSYEEAVKTFATGLDGVSVAVGSDSCGLKSVATVLAQVVPRLANATVKVEGSETVKIIVGTADVYDELYKASVALENGDAAAFGDTMGALLNKLKTSGCSTKACTILEGLLASLQLEGADFTACAADLDQAWQSIPTAMRSFEAGGIYNIKKGMAQIGNFLTESAEAVGNCGVSDLGHILEDTATKLGDGAVATEIGDVVQVLVSGSDVTLDFSKLLADFKAGQYSAVGHDLGSLSTWLKSTDCTTFVCKLTEGLLNAAAIPFQNLKACETDLSSAEADFVAGASAIARKDYQTAITYWSKGLNDVSTSVKDCGMADELKLWENEANVLGYGNVTILGEVASILVHGSDLYPEIYSSFQAFAAHDYRTAGADIGKVMNDLSTWTSGHNCDDDFCYVVSGMMLYLGDVQGDVKACKGDFAIGWKNFTAAYDQLHGGSIGGGDFHFNTDTKAIHAGVKDIGFGLHEIAKGVSDCHLAELAEILEKLAVKLGILPEVGWLEEVLHILINGVHIEQELGDACIDFGDKNWVGFGYNVAKLVKTLA